jgi:hypothetical protein
MLRNRKAPLQVPPKGAKGALPDRVVAPSSLSRKKAPTAASGNGDGDDGPSSEVGPYRARASAKGED